MILGHSEAAAILLGNVTFCGSCFHTLETVSFSFHDEFTKPALSSSATEPCLPSNSTPFFPALFEKDKIYNRGEANVVLWLFHRYHDRNV